MKPLDRLEQLRVSQGILRFELTCDLYSKEDKHGSETLLLQVMEQQQVMNRPPLQLYWLLHHLGFMHSGSHLPFCTSDLHVQNVRESKRARKQPGGRDGPVSACVIDLLLV